MLIFLPLLHLSPGFPPQLPLKHGRCSSSLRKWHTLSSSPKWVVAQPHLLGAQLLTNDARGHVAQVPSELAALLGHSHWAPPQPQVPLAAVSWHLTPTRSLQQVLPPLHP